MSIGDRWVATHSIDASEMGLAALSDRIEQALESPDGRLVQFQVVPTTTVGYSSVSPGFIVVALWEVVGPLWGDLG